MSSWGRIYNYTVNAIRVQSDALAKLQEQASTGKRILRISDAPEDAYRILDLNAQSQSLATYTKNIAVVSGNLGIAAAQLVNISETVRSIKTDLGAAASDLSDAQRDLLADGIDGLLADVVAMANLEYMGQYIFSGSDTAQKPYEIIRDAGGKIIEVRYQGSGQDMPVPVAPGVEQSGVMVGDEIFRNNDRQAPVFLGNTGAAAGVGTSSVRGDVWLSVTHTSSGYQGGSGLAEGDDASQDTILGAHTITITGGNTAKLDGGPEVTFAGTETNLKLTNSDGDIVYVDITSANNGSWTVTGQGTLSIDGGVTTVAIDFGEQSQAVTDPATGRALFVDSTGITRTGVEPVRVPGTYDLFNMVINARDLMLNSRGLTFELQGDLLREALLSIEEAAGGIGDAAASAGARGAAMNGVRDNLDNLKFSVDAQVITLHDVDAIQLAIDLSRVQMFYQMALASAGKLLSLSLLDFI